MEQYIPVDTYLVKHFHDDCATKGGGEFLPTGMMLASNPPQYPHKCNNCGKEQTFYKRYPFIDYKPKEDC